MDRQTIIGRVRGPIDRILRIWAVALLVRAISDYNRNHGSIYAGAITYFLLLSLFPLMVVVTSVIGLLARDPNFQKQVVEQIVSLLPSGAGVEDQVTTMIEGIARPQSSIVGFVGLVGAIWAASGVFGAVRKSLNNAFDVQAGQSFIRGRVHDIASVIAVVLMALASSSLTTALALARSWMERWYDGPLNSVGWGLVFLLLPLVLSFVFFILVYRLIPNITIRWRDLWFGALVAALGFELSKVFFTIYLTRFANFAEVYGALGSVIALLIFVFTISNIAIIGAEIASEIAKTRE